MAFPIVAIGASAGGLEAISEFLAVLPPKSEMAYIVIQHLDPDHKSLLAEILSKKTAMPVLAVHEGLLVESAHVYVIPPNVSLTLSPDRFHLTPRAHRSERHHPVDILFTSLAEARAEGGAIGIVLSGGDSDGSLGVQAIKHSGGITFAQSPESARFPGMPTHAIETGCVDFVLSPRDIAHELMRLGRHPYLRAPPRRAGQNEAPEEVPAASEEETLRRVFRRLRTAHGVDFTHYKRSTLHRRLARRMALRKLDELTDYVAVLDDDPQEADALYQDFLIRVTSFFREPDSFEGLRQRVFPSVCEGRSSKDPIRIWVPGCASGEEVYSVAIALVEYLGERVSSAGIQIFGTDVSETAIEKARAGRYLENIAEEVSAERLQRFFVKEDGHYRIGKSIRDLCIFARQDLTRDPPFSRLDLVSCRNLLIYLDTVVQRRVMQVLHYSLRPTGFLLLGPSESVGSASELFELLDKQHRIYTRKSVAAGMGLERGQSGTELYTRSQAAVNEEARVSPEGDSAQREADRLLLARFAPASLLLDEALNIVQVRGETGPYLELASGPASLNLHRVARPELLVELTPAIQEARESGAEVRREGLCVDQRRDIAIEVIPLKRLSTERCFLILFEDGARPASGRRAQAVSAVPESEKDRRLAQLEREVSALRDYLQATMEEHEAVKEELKSAHEEVLSANEEFQSTNEELETSKEELQSSNEELTTTNEELRNRNRELSVLNSEVQKARGTSERARAYADAIIEAVGIPLVILDDRFTILRANHAYFELFKVRAEETEDRRLFEVGNGQWNTAPLRETLTAVLARGPQRVPAVEIAAIFPLLGSRVMCVSACSIPGDGEREALLLLAIEDITEQRETADDLREVAERKDEFLAMLAHELRNPLTPITHAIHLLRRPDASAASSKLYSMIERQTQRLVRLVEDLLDVARFSRGLIEIKREAVDLVPLVRHTAEAARARIEQNQQVLVLDLPEKPLRTIGDPLRLEQVIANLLENAAKYTDPSGQITLTLTHENDEASVSVRDNGIGIDPNMIERIFDLFRQVDRTLARSGGGLGLGLTVVRRILELHGGRIEARSAGLGHGSEFVVWLPLRDSLTSLAPAERRAPPSSYSLDSPGRRVLIVDDNADSTESMQLLARAWGHEVAVAGDGPRALAVSANFHPDIALIDIGLPGMNGYELARRLRVQTQNSPLHLVALTGYGRPEDRDKARQAGFDVHLVKPADIETLRALLARDLNNPVDG